MSSETLCFPIAFRFFLLKRLYLKDGLTNCIKMLNNDFLSQGAFRKKLSVFSNVYFGNDSHKTTVYREVYKASSIKISAVWSPTLFNNVLIASTLLYATFSPTISMVMFEYSLKLLFYDCHFECFKMLCTYASYKALCILM